MKGNVRDSDIRLLRVFLAVVECGGFSSACAKLNIGESTISAHMSDLELRLGVRLCDRGRGGFRLTEDGAAVHAYANEMVNGLETFRTRVAALKSELSGSLRLVVPDALCTDPRFRIGAAIKLFTAREHNVHFTLLVMSPREAEQAVLKNQADLAISPEHQRLSGIDYEPLFIEQNFLYAGKDHPLFGRPDRDITQDQLREFSFVSRGYHASFDYGLLNEASFGATVFSIEAAFQLVRSGAFLGFMPEHFAAPWVQAGEIRQILPETMKFGVPLSIITHASHSNRLVTRTFLNDLRLAQGGADLQRPAARLVRSVPRA